VGVPELPAHRWKIRVKRQAQKWQFFEAFGSSEISRDSLCRLPSTPAKPVWNIQ